LCAVIKGVDEYADLIRASAATAGNDHRLGANEAPPAIISVYLGSQLMDILEQIADGGATSSSQGGLLKIGVTTLPDLPKDSTDRNRTSPFAFTGNKFEFRMVGSSASTATASFTLNTIAAEILRQIADRLEKAKDFQAEVQKLLREIVKKHKKIIFNGNNYSDAWVEEAKERGLPNINSTVAAIQAMIADKNVALFQEHEILTRHEMESRCEINLENYIKVINIEALTMLEMAKRQILPAVIKYAAMVADSINTIKKTGVKADISVQEELLKEVSSLAAAFRNNIAALEKAVTQAVGICGDTFGRACFYRDQVFVKMGALRATGDKLETLVDEDYWPMPTYGDLLFNV